MAARRQTVRVFLCYARDDDEPFVKRLYEDLTANGFDVWWDRVSMPSRQLTFHQEIADAIRAHDRFVFVVGPAAVRSRYVRQEWRWALELDKPVNPIVRLDGVRADGGKRDGYDLIPEQLKLIHSEDFRDDAQYDTHLANLVSQLSDPEPPLGKLVGVPSLPAHFLARADRLRALKDAVLVDLQKPVVITGAAARVGIQGMGGIGKSVLAAALARDRDVRRSYPDGVIWVTVGAQPNLLRLQTELARTLGCSEPLDSVGRARDKLRELLLDKAVLLVLDDVWDARAADAFDVLGVRCRAVVTTRDSGIIHTIGGTLHQVHLLTESEALHLLASSVGMDRDALPDAAGEIVSECGCLPLAVALCAGMAGRGIAWDSILRALRQADLDRIRDRHSINEQHSSIYRAMQVSVDALTPDERSRFAELAVFPPDDTTPEAAVGCLWAHTGNLDDLDCEDLLITLSERSLIRLDTVESPSGGAPLRRVSLHDLLFDYATRLGDDRETLHNQLLEAYRKKCPDGWPSGPNDGYFFQYLCHHLLEAGRREELEELLTDFAFLQAKVNALGPQPLVEDYDLLKVERNEPLGLIQGAIMLAANILTRSPARLAYQLHGRMGGARAPAVRRLLDKARAPAECWLRPLFPCLTPPGGALIRTLEGHSGGVPSVVLHADGRRAVSGSWDKTLKVWDLETGECLRTVKGGVNPVALHADGRRAVSASGDHMLKVWDLETGECLRALEGHVDWVTSVALHPDGRRALSAEGSYDYTDKTLKLWDLETGECLRTLEGHTKGVNCVSLHADGLRAVSASHDETLKVWDVETGECLRTLEGHTGWVYSVALHADGRRAVSGSQDHTLKVWDLETGECLRTLEGHTDGVESVALHADGRRAVSASTDLTLKVWDLETGECLGTLEGHTHHVESVALHADGRRAVSASLDHTLKVWDLESGECLRTLEGHTWSVQSVALHADGRRAVSASWDNTLKVWDLESGECLRMLEGHADWIKYVALHADGRRAVSAEGSYDGTENTLKVWDLESGECLRTLEGHTTWVRSVALHGDGRRAVSASKDRRLKVWDLESGECLRTLEGHTDGVRSVALHADGRRAVSASLDHTLKVWDLETGECLRTLEGHWKAVTSVALHADGRRVVSASWDNTLKVWDLETGECLRTLRGHSEGVNCVSLHADGLRAVSASHDETLKVWDLETGQEVASFTAERGLERSLNCCAVAPDGDTIVAGDSSGRVYFLQLEENPDYA